MRILLISDLHGNWPALEAIREPFDACLCAGDLVDYGCEPEPVIDWVRKNVTACVRGNHDHMVAQNVVTVGQTGFRYLSGATRPISRQRLGEADRRFLADLPVTKFLTIDGFRLLMVHATPRDPLDEYAPAEAAFWKRRLENVDVDLVLVGHTHYSYDLQIGRTRVINPGSVGLPRDHDWRASYAILENGRLSFHRIRYDVERAVRSVQEAPLPLPARDLLAHIYRQGTLPNGDGKPLGKS
jgi:putative phosphoesterase